MTWETKMVINHWQQVDGGWQLAYKVSGKRLFIPFWMAATWKAMGLIPTEKGAKQL